MTAGDCEIEQPPKSWAAAVSAQGNRRGRHTLAEPRRGGFDAFDCAPRYDAREKQEILHAFYRAELKKLVPELLEKWQAILGVTVSAWGIKRMETKWGTCNIEAQRIWLNLELAKKPVQCLEYILVHELTHLLERHHNERFTRVLDQHLPQWRTLREELNGSVLAEF